MMGTYHEPYERLSKFTLNMHRAIMSLKEELEAIDWYQHRVDATDDEDLKDYLFTEKPITEIEESSEHAAEHHRVIFPNRPLSTVGHFH